MAFWVRKQTKALPLPHVVVHILMKRGISNLKESKVLLKHVLNKECVAKMTYKQEGMLEIVHRIDTRVMVMFGKFEGVS